LPGPLPCLGRWSRQRAGDLTRGSARDDPSGRMITMAPADPEAFQVTPDSWHEPDGLQQA